MVKVDFAMVGIVSKCSPSLFSLLGKNIAIATSCDSTSNIPCNAREGKLATFQHSTSTIGKGVTCWMDQNA